MTNIYAISICSLNVDKVIGHFAWVIQAENEQAAMDHAKVVAESNYPSVEGWADSTFDILEIKLQEKGQKE